MFEAILYLAYTNLIGRTNNEWLYSGSTVALQWLYNEQKTNKRRTKDEGRTNDERRKSVGKLVLSRRILERVRQVSSIFYAFKLTF